MTYISLVVVTLVAAPFLAFSQMTHKKTNHSGGDEQVIRQLLDEQGAALERKDVEALDRMWASDYTFINPTGQVVTKAQRLAVLGSSDTKIDSVSRDEANIRMYGHTAVVISRTMAKGRVGGKEINAQFRGTTVLVKRNGRWQMVTHQDNIIPPQ